MPFNITSHAYNEKKTDLLWHEKIDTHEYYSILEFITLLIVFFLIIYFFYKLYKEIRK